VIINGNFQRFDVCLSHPAEVSEANEFYAVPDLGNYTECTQDIESIVDSPLDIFEIHTDALVLVNFHDVY